MTVRTRVSEDAYRVGERFLFSARIEDWLTPGVLPVCIYSTGNTGSPWAVVHSTTFDGAMAAKMTKTHSFLSIEAGGTSTFGNDTAIQAIDQAVAWSEAQGRVGPFLLVGCSMGFMDLMAWARTHQAKVAGVIGITPATNLSEARASNRTGHQAAIDAAYGGLYDPVVHGPTHDPMQYAAQLNFPIQLFAAADDAVTLLTDVQNFAALAPNASVVNLGNSGGHAKASVDAATKRPEFDLFIAANGGVGHPGGGAPQVEVFVTEDGEILLTEDGEELEVS